MQVVFGSFAAFEPYEFWEYTTTVLERFFEFEPGFGEEGTQGREELDRVRTYLVRKFNEAGIRCSVDNKIAFGIKNKTSGQVIYVGFYDGKMTMGMVVRADEWLKPHRKEGA